MTDKLSNIEPVGALAVPDYLKEVTGTAGLENVRPEDLILPRLMICQALSPQKKRSSDNFIPGLEDGNLFNTVTGEVYGGKVKIVPLVYTQSRILFRDLEEGGGMLCQSLNGINGGKLSPTCDACPKSKFSEDGDVPECSLFMNFACLLMPSKQLIAVSFKSSGLKAARAWISRMKYTDKPIFSQVYAISTVEKKGAKGEYFVPTIRFDNWVQDVETYKFAEAAYNSIKGKNIKTDEPEAGEAGADAGEDIPF
jgi:hypothetical protein